MLLLWLACTKNLPPPPTPGELRWLAHTTTQLDRMDVTVHQVAEVTERSQPVEGGTEVVHSGRIVERTAQTSFGRVDPAQLAELPGIPELRFVIAADGTIVSATAVGGQQNELIAALATRVQHAPLPRVAVGGRWSRTQTIDLGIDGPDGAPIPFRVALDVQGERQPSDGPGEQHAMVASLRVVGNTGRRKVVNRASVSACTRIDPDDRRPLRADLRMRAIVIVGADDESPTTLWMTHRSQRLTDAPLTSELACAPFTGAEEPPRP